MKIHTLEPASRIGGKMIRLSMPFFYNLGAKLHQLSSLQAEVTLAEAYGPLWVTKSELEKLFGTNWFIPAIKSAWYPGQRLLAAITVLTDRTDLTTKLSLMDVISVETPRAEFETVIRAELEIADVFYVSRKGAYDVSVLIANAESLCSVELGAKVPAAIPEIREAGKCLAFELTTASGFHLFRATEIVVRAYWLVVSNNATPPKMESLGRYLQQMEDQSLGSAKVVAVLKQITSLHRNPLIHPEDSLNLEEAVGLTGICVSAINAMLKEIPDPPPPALAAYLPSPQSP